MIRHHQGERQVALTANLNAAPALIVHHLMVAVGLYEILDGTSDILRAVAERLEATDPAHPAVLEFIRALDHAYARYEIEPQNDNADHA